MIRLAPVLAATLAGSSGAKSVDRRANPAYDERVVRPAYTRLQIDERRRQLLDAGAVLFAERAYEEISMREVAAAAGVSKALLYHYFTCS
ncbi:MAG: TetR/AcrR family transcriptional regulator [Actinobacteria bacterium]|nr:TetR/AcrR family transcriptional regulator [Actinomycetota bacterium]